MTRKRYAGINKAQLIHILNTTSTIPADQVKKINKRIYQADFRIPKTLMPTSYKELYEELNKAYHQRMIAGEA